MLPAENGSAKPVAFMSIKRPQQHPTFHPTQNYGHSSTLPFPAYCPHFVPSFLGSCGQKAWLHDTATPNLAAKSSPNVVARSLGFFWLRVNLILLLALRLPWSWLIDIAKTKNSSPPAYSSREWRLDCIDSLLAPLVGFQKQIGRTPFNTFN